MTDITVKSLSATVEAAIKQLITVEHFHAASIVSMPVCYPSGASVVLEVSAQAGRVFISDRGGAHQEAEFLGVSRYFSRESSRVAAEAGIKFDGRDMFIAEVPVDRVSGAMTIVASCSANAANSSAMRAAEREDKSVKSDLFDRLSDVYGANGFDRDVEMLGSGSHLWRFDAVVKRPAGLAIFNSVTKAYVSAVGTAAKFHDIARLDVSPRRIAVITSEKDVANWIGVIAGASDAVIEMKAANDQYLRASKLAA